MPKHLKLNTEQAAYCWRAQWLPNYLMPIFRSVLKKENPNKTKRPEWDIL